MDHIVRFLSINTEHSADKINLLSTSDVFYLTEGLLLDPVRLSWVIDLLTKGGFSLVHFLHSVNPQLLPHVIILADTLLLSFIEAMQNWSLLKVDEVAFQDFSTCKGMLILLELVFDVLHDSACLIDSVDFHGL